MSLNLKLSKGLFLFVKGCILISDELSLISSSMKILLSAKYT